MHAWLPIAALALTPVGSIDGGGLSGLIAELGRSIASRFQTVEGRVLRVEGDRVWIDRPELEAGTRLQWLVSDPRVTEPPSLAGSVLTVCGELSIEESDGTVALGRFTPELGCGPPVPGTLVRTPDEPVRIAVRAGRATPSLAALLDEVIVVATVARLRQTGRFEPLWSNASNASSAESVDAGTGAIAVISAAARGQTLHLLVEIAASRPRPLRDIIHLTTELVPEALWRQRGPLSRNPYGRSSAVVDGVVIDLARIDEDGGGQAHFLVMTEEAISRVSPDPAAGLEITVLEDLTKLQRAPLRTRVLAGSLVVDRSSVPPQVCFGTTFLASGHCRRHDQGELHPASRDRLDGVPFLTEAGIAVAHYEVGTDILTGTLHDPSGERVLAVVGRFRDLRPALAGGLLVQRPDGGVQPFPGAASAGLERAPGDAWLELAPGLRLEAGGRPWGEPDELRWVDGSRVIDRLAVAGNVVALETVDVDRDGRRDLIVATAVDGGPSRLTIYSLP